MRLLSLNIHTSFCALTEEKGAKKEKKKKQRDIHILDCLISNCFLMGILKPFLLLMFSLFVVCCDGYTFYVGGRDGWVLHPSESYSDWAGRNRFQVNDTLVFKYEKGEDSVLEVSQQDFDQCNLSNPIQKMDTGDSVFKFDRSGPFFFVSGTGDRCKQGQKLIVVVLAVRPKSPVVQPTPPSMSPSSPPSMSPSTPPVLSPALAPALSPGPNSPFLQPPATSPVSSPTISPIMSPTRSPASSPLSMSPPTNSPGTSPPSVSPAPSPFTVSPPVSSPTITPASSPSTQPSAPGTPPTPPSPSGSPTQPSPPGTITAPSTGTPNNPTGSSPGSSDSRVSSVILAAAVLIVNYGIFN